MTTFNEDVEINGSLDVLGTQDETQLEVRAHSAQTEPLQTWEKSDGTPLVQVTGDGRLELGALDLGTQDALIEANQDIILPDTTTPRRGLQSIGQITGDDTHAISGPTDWGVHELTLTELESAASVDGTHTALRSQITQNASGDADQATLRAGHFEVINQGGNATNPVKEAIGLQSSVTNEDDGHLDTAVGVEITINDSGSVPIQKAYGLRVEDVDQGSLINYAIHTGKGIVHVGDHVEMAPLDSEDIPDNPAAGVLIYSKQADNKLYARNVNGEFELGAGGPSSDGMPTGAMTMWPTDTPPAGWLLCAGQSLDMTTYQTLLEVLLAGISVDDLGLGTGTAFTTTSASSLFNATSHGLQNNDVIMLSNSGGALPTGLSAVIPYFVIDQTADTFRVSLTTEGSAVTFSDEGTGTHSFHCEFKNLDMRGRFPLGQDDMGGTSADRVTAAEADSLGGTSGAETHTLIVSEMPAHSHSIKIPGGGASSVIDRSWNNGGNQTTSNTTAINEAGGDQAHNNMPPYLTLNYIIKT